MINTISNLAVSIAMSVEVLKKCLIAVWVLADTYN